MAKSNSFVVLTDVKVVSDAETRELEGGKNLVSFTVADNPGNDKALAKFIRVTVSGKLGDIMGQLKKGDRVNVVGKEEFRTFEKKDGTTGYSFDIPFPMSVTRVYVDSAPAADVKTEEKPTPPAATKKGPGRPPKAKTEPVKAPWDDADDE